MSNRQEKWLMWTLSVVLIGILGYLGITGGEVPPTPTDSPLEVGAVTYGYQTNCYATDGGDKWQCDSGGEIEINSGATLDINAGATFDVATTTNLDDVDIDGTLQVDGESSFGVSGTGVDIRFFSDTAGDYLMWDTSGEVLIITGTNAANALNITDGNLSVTDDVDVGGTLNADGIFTVDTDKFTVTPSSGNTDISGTLQVDGITTVDGLLNADAGIAVDTNVFTVADVSGNTQIAGTLNADGIFTVDTDKFTVTPSSGNTDISGTLQVDGVVTADSLINANAGLAVDTSAFTVADTSGNTQIAGTLNADGIFTVDTDKFTVTPSSGNTDISGTLQVDGATDLDGALTVDGVITVISTTENIGLPTLVAVDINWTTGAGGTDASIAIGAGEIWYVWKVWIRTDADWTAGAGDDEFLNVGTGGDADGFLVATHTELLAAYTSATGFPAGYYGLEAGDSGAYTTDGGGPFIIVGAETIDIAWGATGDDLTGGGSTVFVYYTRMQ